MDGALSARFLAGAGVDPAALREAVSLAAGLAAILWAAFESLRLYRNWAEEEIELFDLQIGIARIAVLAMAIIAFVR
jgi:integrating conjugative element protein (TIGR03758 family)